MEIMSINSGMKIYNIPMKFTHLLYHACDINVHINKKNEMHYD